MSEVLLSDNLDCVLYDLDPNEPANVPKNANSGLYVNRFFCLSDIISCDEVHDFLVCHHPVRFLICDVDYSAIYQEDRRFVLLSQIVDVVSLANQMIILRHDHVAKVKKAIEVLRKKMQCFEKELVFQESVIRHAS